MKIVMVDPYNYGLEYILPDNKRMKQNFKRNPPDKHKALLQWLELYKIYLKLEVEVEILKSAPNLPDMVFTANAGLPYRTVFVLSNFRYDERKKEQNYYNRFFNNTHRIITWHKFPNAYFEGQGDALWAEEKLLVGYGLRTSKMAVGFLRGIIDKEIVALELRNDCAETFYIHLDTALAYLGNNNYLVYQHAFNQESFRKIENLGNLILVDQPDADQLVCNAVVIGNKIIMQQPSKQLQEKLENLDYEIISVDTSEFIKSGGSVKCLSLIL